MSDKWSSMGRRRFMENLGALGVSSTTLNFLDQEELEEVTDNPEDEVPYVAMLKGNGDRREAVYKTIPREEWERRQTALSARDQIARKVDKELDSDNISVAFTSMDQSPTGFGVEVENVITEYPNGEVRGSRADLEEIEKLVPTEMEAGIDKIEEEVTRQGIPVEVTESHEELTCSYDLERNYDNLPGGIAIASSYEGGTLCAPFESREFGTGWTTAGHVVGSDKVNVYQENGSKEDDPFGYSKEAKNDGNNLDYAFIDMISDEDISKWITDNDASERELELTGIVTNEELENQEGNEDYILEGQGRTTCRSSGPIHKVVGSGTEAVETEWAPKDGDSGGPLFYTPNDNEAYIAGIVMSRVERPWRNTTAKSTTAETTEIELDGYFLWN